MFYLMAKCFPIKSRYSLLCKNLSRVEMYSQITYVGKINKYKNGIKTHQTCTFEKFLWVKLWQVRCTYVCLTISSFLLDFGKPKRVLYEKSNKYWTKVFFVLCPNHLCIGKKISLPRTLCGLIHTLLNSIKPLQSTRQHICESKVQWQKSKKNIHTCTHTYTHTCIHTTQHTYMYTCRDIHEY
jgi:hypothetical protein